MMLAAHFEPGGPEKLSIQQTAQPTLRQHEVLIKVVTTAINRADTLQRRGIYPPPAGESAILGLEATGFIAKLGPGSTKWSVGDRVMALLPGGGNAEYVAAHEDHVMPVAKEMSFVEAAAIPEVWLTAYQLLHKVGHLRQGEVVLIHAGASGVGTAAIQLVQLAGATSIITAGSQEKIEAALGLGASHGINYKTQNFAEEVLRLTEGRGVDLIVDCIGGSYWEKNTAAAALDARWILYGLMGGGQVSGDLLTRILRKRINITGSTLRTRTKQYKAELVQDFTQNALNQFASGKLQVVIDSEFQLRHLADAHHKMESNANTGKIIIRVRTDDGGELE